MFGKVIDRLGTLDLVLSALRAFDLRDAIGVGSLAAFVYGVAQWSVPAAWMVVGACGLLVWARPYLARSRR